MLVSCHPRVIEKNLTINIIPWNQHSLMRGSGSFTHLNKLHFCTNSLGYNWNKISPSYHVRVSCVGQLWNGRSLHLFAWPTKLLGLLRKNNNKTYFGFKFVFLTGTNVNTMIYLSRLLQFCGNRLVFTFGLRDLIGRYHHLISKETIYSNKTCQRVWKGIKFSLVTNSC